MGILDWIRRSPGAVEPVAEADASLRASQVRGDNPIKRSDEDTLGRATVAASFAKGVMELDAAEGVVVGVLGRWGSGKTSFVNLARAQFERSGATVLDFNPWMFSGTPQLVDAFFTELSSQLKLRPDLAQVGEGLEEYGDAFSGLGWLPFVGTWIERGRVATDIIGKALKNRKEGVGGRRRKLEDALRGLARPIVVVLDDIDRLSTNEIREVFKLVRLTASFPNIVYLVAFDRARVEGALGEEGIPGRDYLEKILQVAIDLPNVPDQVLARQVLVAIDAALKGIESPGPFDEHAWPDIFAEIIRPLIRTMRDVRRYTVSIRSTIASLGGNVALADVLALEAVRIFLPDVFARLHGAIEGLTSTTDRRHENPELKTSIDVLVGAAGEKAEVVRDLIRRLFPAGSRHLPQGSHFGSDWRPRWLRERRVAHDDILRLYLERAAGEDFLAFVEAERAWTLMADRRAFDGYLRALDPGQLENVIGSLGIYEDNFEPRHVVPGVIVLLNILPDLPDRPRGFFDFGSSMVITRVTYRLVRSLKDPDAIEAAVRAILPEITTLSAKLELIWQVGFQEGVGHKLVSEAAAAEFERTWREEVRSARPEQLTSEKSLLRVLLVAKEGTQAEEPGLQIADSPELTLAVLIQARTETMSQAMGSRAVKRMPRLAWEGLVKLYGDEPTLRRRIEAVKAAHPEGADELLILADKYLGGWKPGQFDDDD